MSQERQNTKTAFLYLPFPLFIQQVEPLSYHCLINKIIIASSGKTVRSS